MLDALEHGLPVQAAGRKGDQRHGVRPLAAGLRALEPSDRLRKARAVIGAGGGLLDDHHVEFARPEAPGEIAAEPGGDVEADLAVPRREGREDPAHGRGEDVVGQADAHGGGAGGVGQQGLRLLLQREDPARMAQQALARGRRPGGARAAVDELAADGLLQPPQLLADRGLRHVQPFGRQREAAGVGDGDEGAQEAGVQHGGVAGPGFIRGYRDRKS